MARIPSREVPESEPAEPTTPMKLYLVVSEEYWGVGIRGAFSSREKALAYAEARAKVANLDYHILETVLDEPEKEAFIQDSGGSETEADPGPEAKPAGGGKAPAEEISSALDQLAQELGIAPSTTQGRAGRVPPPRRESGSQPPQ